MAQRDTFLYIEGSIFIKAIYIHKTFVTTVQLHVIYSGLTLRKSGLPISHGVNLQNKLKRVWPICKALN